MNLSQQDFERAWWDSLSHEGNLLSAAQVKKISVSEVKELFKWNVDRLYDAVLKVRKGDDKAIGELLDIVFERVLGYKDRDWLKGSAVDTSWTQRSATGEAIRPRRIWQSGNGFVFPVFVVDANLLGSRQSAGRTRLGIGNGRRAVARVIEWLRKSSLKLAILTNGRQLRLIFAGPDYHASCEWDTELWFESGQPGVQVQALQILLGSVQLTPENAGEDPPLLKAIYAARSGQAELSSSLGERVREAVELLIRESRTSIEDLLAKTDGSVSNRDIYIAATRIIMRMVVVFFAEARDLLPRSNRYYHESYGLNGLRDILDRMAHGRSSDRLQRLYYAWPRTLALFRMIHEGCPHPDIPVPHYGGELFVPGSLEHRDPIRRALTAFEKTTLPITDASVYRILDLLTRTQVKVKQGNKNIFIWDVINFADLGSEYIGILYEGLLDYELRKAAANTFVLLNLGDMPVLSLDRLEQMSDDQLEKLVEKLKQKSKPKIVSGEEEESSEDGEDEDEEQEEAGEEIEEEESVEGEIETATVGDAGDIAQQAYDRAMKWAVKAVKAGKLVTKPRSKKAEALEQYEKDIEAMARKVVPRENITLPGDWFLIRWGGTRKGAGTFYTRPQLANPTIRRTLEPLIHTPPIPPASRGASESPSVHGGTEGGSVDIFGNPLPTNLFGEEEKPRKRRKRN